MERLSADDQVMLWPDALWPQEIGTVAILDGGSLLDRDGRVRTRPVREVLMSRLHLVPRLRQLLHTPGRGLGGPLWIDAPAFDIDQHLRTVELPAPGDEATLLQAVERVRRERLDRSQPLWRMVLFSGLPDNRIGLYVKMHHAMADGIAGIATIATFLDAGPEPGPASAPPWSPRLAPTVRELLMDNLHRHADQFGRALTTLGHPVTTAHRVGAVWPSVRGLLAAEQVPSTSLNRVLGPDRTIALIRDSLEVVTRIARTHRATVNDVLLAIIAGGLRGLFTSRGERVDEVRIDVPVTLRTEQTRARARGNLIGQMIVTLPVGESDPGRRLTLIAAQTATGKKEQHPSMGVVLRGRIARRAMLKVLDRNPVNVTSADLVGPPQPVYLAGARLLEVFPVLPLMGTVSLGVGALSYAGQFNVAVIADRDAHPDLDVFAAGARTELATLADVMSPSVRAGQPSG